MKGWRYFVDLIKPGVKPKKVLPKTISLFCHQKIILWQGREHATVSLSMQENIKVICLHAANRPKLLCAVPEFRHMSKDLQPCFTIPLVCAIFPVHVFSHQNVHCSHPTHTPHHMTLSHLFWDSLLCMYIFFHTYPVSLQHALPPLHTHSSRGAHR